MLFSRVLRHKTEKDKCDEIDNLVNTNGHSPLIGYAIDGFPIYGPVGYKNDENGSRVSRILKSSFNENKEYVKDLGDLDECNGITSVTPEYPDGIYHYVMTIESENNGLKVKRIIDPYIDISLLESKITSYKSLLVEWCQKEKNSIHFKLYILSPSNPKTRSICLDFHKSLFSYLPNVRRTVRGS